jgi:hypothetical protein
VGFTSGDIRIDMSIHFARPVRPRWASAALTEISDTTE